MSASACSIRLAMIAFSLALAANHVVAADEAIDLRGPAPKKGLTIHEVSKFTLKDADFSLTQGDNKAEGKIDIIANGEKEIEVLAVDGRDIVKLKTKIIKDETTHKRTVDGKTMEETEAKKLQGQVVFSELNKKTWKHELDDAKPTEEQELELKNFDEPENDDDLYPAEKVKVGHAWKIEPSAFKKLLGSKFFEAKGNAKSKFVRTEKVGDDLCAVIESEVDLTGKVKDDDGNDMTISIKGTIVNHRSIASGVDLKTTINGRGVFAVAIKQDGQNTDVRYDGKLSSIGTASVKNR